MSLSYSYRGWVPTCSGGGLSFSNFGNCKKPSSSVPVNICDNNIRYIISYQKRRLSDQIVPLRHIVAKKIFGLETTFWFLCVAKRNISYEPSSSRMEGRVFLFHKKYLWRENAEAIVKSYQQRLEQFAGSCLETYFSNEYEQLKTDIKEHATFIIDFDLKRNGVISINYDAIQNHGLSVEKIQLPNEEAEQAEDLYYLSSQMFFFLRDISHSHIHHNPTDDNIVRLYPHTDNDYEWRCDTARELLRRILMYKKSSSDKVFQTSLGMIPYLKYFMKISKEDAGKAIYPIIDMRLLEGAIKAAQQTHNSIKITQSGEKESVLNWMVGGIGLLLAIISLSEIVPSDLVNITEASTVLVGLTNLMVTYTLQTLGVFVGFVLTLLVLFGVVDPTEWQFVRDSIRIGQAFRQGNFSAFLIAIGLALYVAFALIITYQMQIQ